VPYSILSNRINGRTTLRERPPPNLKLTKLEEEVIVQYILDIDERGFVPRLASVEDIANYILESRRARHVESSGHIDSYNAA